MEIEPLKISAEDSKFIESRQIAVSEIARGFGIPPNLMIDVSRVSSTNLQPPPPTPPKNFDSEAFRRRWEELFKGPRPHQ